MTVKPILPVIDYTSRDYESIRSDLIRLIRQRLPQWTANDPSDFGVALVEAVAYTADQLHYYLDRVANESYLGTAIQRENLVLIARLLGYTPYTAEPSSVMVEFTNEATSGEVVIPRMARVQALLEQTDGTIVRTFETLNEVTVPAGGKVAVRASQGRTHTRENVGVSSGLPFQRMRLPRVSVLLDSITVTTVLGDVSVDWVRVDRLEEASNEDRVFTAERLADGSTVITFGDGLNGEIPALHAAVLATYTVGGGAADVPANAITSLVDPVIPNITVNNPSAAFGGRDPESINSIRVNAARAFRARDRAVTTYDYMAMTKSYPGISNVKVVSNNGVSVVVFVVGTNDSPFSLAPVDTEGLRHYLTGVSMAGVDVTVVNAMWVPIYVDLVAHCQPAARRDTVASKVREVLARLFSRDILDFDAQLTVGDIYAALQGVPGLAYPSDVRIGTSPQTLSPDPLNFSSIAIHAVPYWDNNNLSVVVDGGV